MTTFAADVSSWQVPVDDTYPYRWISIRANDGEFRDPNFAHNYRWACDAADAGRLDGFTVYSVYEMGVDAVGVLMGMIPGRPHPKMVWMQDVESWSGRITSDHSADVTAQFRKAAAWLGDRRRVCAYANRNDYNLIFPTRPGWVPLVVASYGSFDPAMDHEIGWQYSDGETRWPVPAGYPRGCKPFGNCDMNVFPGLSPADLAVRLGVGDEEFVMDDAAKKRFDAQDARLSDLADSVSALSAAVAKLAQDVANGVNVNGLLNYAHTGYPSLEAHLTGVPGYVPVSARQ